MPKWIFIQCLILYACFSTSAFSNSNNPKIKVKVDDGLKYVTIVGQDLTRKLIQSGQTKTFRGKRKIKFNCYKLHKFSRRVFYKQRNILIATITSSTGVVKLNKNYYKGAVTVVGDTHKNRCYVINTLRLDDYLSTLLSKEMKASWPIEALKAQAVAARTYAMFMIKSKRAKQQKGQKIYYDIESSERHQVSGHLKDSTTSTLQASRKTSGFVLKNTKSEIAPAFFHAKCGGKTLTPDQVWENKISGYSSVPDPFCKTNGVKPWRRSLPVNKVKSFLTWLKKEKKIEYVSKPKRVKFMSDGFSSNKLKVYVEDKGFKIKKAVFRRFFGRKTFLSNNFSLDIKDNQVHIHGKGHGHGVGLCQWGAMEMANQGFNYKRILAYYYPGLKIAKIH